jgi:hypothetical protein
MYSLSLSFSLSPSLSRARARTHTHHTNTHTHTHTHTLSHRKDASPPSVSKQVVTSDDANSRTTSSSGDEGRSAYMKVSGGNTGPQVTQAASGQVTQDASDGGGGALDELGFGSEKKGNLLSLALNPAGPCSLRASRASVPPSPPSPVQTSAWRLRAKALNQTCGEARAPPKTATGSSILIVDSMRHLGQVEQHSVSFLQGEQQPVSVKKEGYSDAQHPEHLVKSPQRSQIKSPGSKGNLLKLAGDQVMKDGSGAVEAALCSVIGTLGFIGQGLRSAAVSFSFCSCSLCSALDAACSHVRAYAYAYAYAYAFDVHVLLSYRVRPV